MDNKVSKLNYKKTFILGFGFFAISLVWPLYNVYVPIFLRDFFNSQFAINSIMTLDNILAVTLIPIIGSLSDRTSTRFGRRMPYLMVGIPISALMFILLPNYSSFLNFMIIITILNFSMAIYRAPTVALMPDITPSHLRSEANGIINFMGGLASVFVLIGGSFLYKANKNYPFLGTAILMFLALFILMKFIKEPNNITVENTVEKDAKISIISSLKDICKAKDKTTLYILLAVFFWFVGYQGVEATFSNYCVQFLKLPVTKASFILGFFALSFLIFAIPAGFVGGKLGKRKTILIGISGDVMVFILLSLIGTIFPLNQVIMLILMTIGGFFWALININSYPMVVEMTTEEKIGTYTGLYYFSSSLAAILGPLFLGGLIDLIGFKFMFLFTALAYAFAWICIHNTRKQYS